MIKNNQTKKTQENHLKDCLSNEKDLELLRFLLVKKGWARFSELRNQFTKDDPNDLVYRSDGRWWSQKANKIYDEKPRCVFNNDENLSQHLNKLTSNGLIQKKKNKRRSKYKICNELLKNKKSLSKKIRNQLLKIKNKDKINSFPNNKLLMIPIFGETYHKSNIESYQIFYGYSKELLQFFDKEDKKEFIKCHQELGKISNKLLGLKKKSIKEEAERRLMIFKEKTNSEKIKKYLENDYFSFYGTIHNLYSGNYPMYDIFESKGTFFYFFLTGMSCIFGSFGIPEELYDFYRLNKRNENEEFSEFINNFLMNDVKNCKKDFCNIWESAVLLKYKKVTYDFSHLDLYELFQWSWDNRKLFEMSYPMDFSYSFFQKSGKIYEFSGELGLESQTVLEELRNNH